MKTFLFLLFLTLINPISSYAQPQWKFHIAFEDGTGAKDTIWMIWDSNATIGVDSALGEGKATFDYSKFNVWIYNQNSDSTKVKAYPPNETISISAYVMAFQYQYPIIVRWDTSLFKTISFPWKIDDAIFSNGWTPPDLSVDMMEIDSVTLPVFFCGGDTCDHFPMSFGIGKTSQVGINLQPGEKELMLFPNPSNGSIYFNCSKDIKEINVYSLLGQKEYFTKIYKPLPRYELNIDQLPQGIYLLEIIKFNNLKSYEKIIKN